MPAGWNVTLLYYLVTSWGTEQAPHLPPAGGFRGGRVKSFLHARNSALTQSQKWWGNVSSSQKPGLIYHYDFTNDPTQSFIRIRITLHNIYCWVNCEFHTLGLWSHSDKLWILYFCKLLHCPNTVIKQYGPNLCLYFNNSIIYFQCNWFFNLFVRCLLFYSEWWPNFHVKGHKCASMSAGCCLKNYACSDTIGVKLFLWLQPLENHDSLPWSRV